MKIKFLSLALQWKRDREVLNLDHKILFFHGQISAGKSTIARIIDFCLGGALEMTIALQQEFVSASLTAVIGEYEVLLERGSMSENVQVTWKNKNGAIVTVQAPIQSKKIEIWEGGIESLSDVLFFLFDIKPLRVKKRKSDDDSPLIRLSFRNFMWYAYLEQELLDSSFYRLEDTMRSNGSKDVLRFVFGYYSEKLSELEIQLEKTKEIRAKKIGTANELQNFLKQFGYGTTQEIESQMEEIKTRLNDVLVERARIEKGYKVETHSSDDLRDAIRNSIGPIEELEQIVADIKERIEQQKALRAELLSSKFKLARVEVSSNVFNNVKFENCPACGNDIKPNVDQATCYLCHQINTPLSEAPQAEEIRLDLDSRILELETSISQHSKALDQQKEKLKHEIDKKRLLDKQLNEQLSNYDTSYLSKFREVDKEIATLEERLRGFEKIKRMPAEIKKLEEDADILIADEQRLKREIETERSSLTKAADYVQELEETFLKLLLDIKLPGITNGDVVKINLKTWEVLVLNQGESSFHWNFYNAGSGGVKTLFNVCYLISIHIVAERYELPLPTFLMIDTPMQNIGENVNKELFEQFYSKLYELSQEELKSRQFIIIDKDFVKPSSTEVDIYERYMTPDQDSHPPLIKYFRFNKSNQN